MVNYFTDMIVIMFFSYNYSTNSWNNRVYSTYLPTTSLNKGLSMINSCSDMFRIQTIPEIRKFTRPMR